MSKEDTNTREEWAFNYFNYFTEIEEHFQKARGTGLFLLSPLDWSLIETWKSAGVPLEAALRGIDEAFAKWRERKTKTRMVNSLAYCAQAVLEQAQIMSGEVVKHEREATPPPFPLDELKTYLATNAAAVRAHEGPAFADVAASLEKLVAEADQHYHDLEDLERRLSVIEEKMTAAARATQSEEAMLNARREFDLQVRPYRGKMTAEQLALLERQFLERKLLESSNLPRLSLFYLR